MASNLAPGVEIIERSFSQRIERGGDAVFGTLGMFSKGPVNERIRVSSVEQLVRVFGKPNDYNYGFFFPVSKILDEAPVELVRVEESTKACAGVTIGRQSGSTTSFSSPITVNSFPLSYDSVFTDHDSDTNIEVELPSGFTDNITVSAVGPGQLYNNISVAIVNQDDYERLRDFQLSIVEASTPSEIQTVGETTYNIAVSGSGLPLSLAEELIDPDNSYNVDTELLDTYLAFETGPSSADEFIVYEFNSGSLVEAYLVSTDPDKKDRYAKSMFANTVIEANSDNIRVFVGTSLSTADDVTPYSTGAVSLSGADALSTSSATLTDELYQQINDNFSSKQDVFVSALVDLDFPVSVKQRLDEVASSRKDCVALLNVSADRMINLSTGQKTSNQTTLVKNWADSTLNVNSSYSALYANYLKVYDKYNDKERWIPCTGHVANRFAFTINNFESWNAVAGLERGIITGVSKVAYNPNEAQMKVIYPANINPIVQLRGEGVVIWGQKTRLSTPSATDRINVRQLLIYIANAMEQYSRSVLFKQNDEFTRAEFLANVNPFLNNIVQRRGIEKYLVVCDSTNNTPEVVARNEFQAYIIVRPTTVAEYVKIVIADVGGSLTISEVVSGVSV